MKEGYNLLLKNKRRAGYENGIEGAGSRAKGPLSSEPDFFIVHKGVDVDAALEQILKTVVRLLMFFLSVQKVELQIEPEIPQVLVKKLTENRPENTNLWAGRSVEDCSALNDRQVQIRFGIQEESQRVEPVVRE